jgi:hypothetical protein
VKQRDKAQRILSGALDQVRTEERLQLDETNHKLQRSLAIQQDLQDKLEEMHGKNNDLHDQITKLKRRLVWSRKTINLIEVNYQEAVKELIAERLTEAKSSEDEKLSFKVALSQMNHLRRATTQALDEIDENTVENQLWFEKLDNDEDLEQALPEFSGLKQLLLLKKKGTRQSFESMTESESPNVRRYNQLFQRDEMISTDDLFEQRNKETSAFTFEFGKPKGTQTDMADIMENLNDFDLSLNTDRLASPMPGGGGQGGESNFSFNFEEGLAIIKTDKNGENMMNSMLQSTMSPTNKNRFALKFYLKLV